MVHFISGVAHMETNVLFCSKLMFTNGKIVVCKYTIRFYSGLCFCQTHIWTSIFLFLFFSTAQNSPLDVGCYTCGKRSFVLLIKNYSL